MAAATATATTGALFGAVSTSRLAVSATSSSPPFLALPRRSLLSSATTLPEIKKISALRLRVTASDDSSGSVDSEDLVEDLKQKWDGLEDKSSVLIYGGGAIVAVWLSSIVVGAINSVPLLPKLMELVGLGYTGWFVYRYLLFKTSRKELATDIDTLKSKITGK
ncbi:Protein CURVATURE THYLAKOID 1A, chloroplastic [Zostera marina]|uniref:Protein CURVATURE THYLAKOID 1A, chloroplastic n=1 Tax=Zostera marina TaxID=29655 RepID=A0A0K9PYX1_ZOSMR|nr:Protein CURVATURE THYLAKOID 1A, chloroplastic [Zostera marina]